jgi:ABC-type transporter Mla MlaB component
MRYERYRALARRFESFGLETPRFLASGQGRAVLKITITDSPDEQTWSLQGLLVGQWAAELLWTWREARKARDTRGRIVDLTEVSSIDRDGEAVLAEIMSQDAEFIAGDVYTRYLLRNLRSKLKRSRLKGREDGDGND